jgi:hypothetical protein
LAVQGFHFSAPAQYSAGNGTCGLAAGDLNGDGRPDIVTINRTDKDVAVLINDGTGHFLPAVKYALSAAGITQPTGVAVGDFNGDGKLDVVVVDVLFGNDGAHAIVLPGNGNGTFGFPIISRSGNSPSNVSVGDLNGDGKPDLFLGGNGSGAVLLGNGDGTFRIAALPFVSNPGSSIIAERALGMADFNGDGRMDVAAACDTYGACIWLQDQNGALGNGVAYSTYPHQLLADTSIAFADINKDGHPDVVIGQNSFNGISVLLGNGDGTVQQITAKFSPLTWYGGSNPAQLAIADFNRDGALDIAAADFNSTSDPNLPPDGYGITIMAGNGDGGRSSLGQFDAGEQAVGIVASDFNSDGVPDIATANLNTGTVDVLINATTTAVTVPRTGWWWDSNLSGIGFFIEKGGNSSTGLFVGGFMYDSVGNPTWLVSTGAMGDQAYTGTWLKATGGQTLLGPYKPPATTAAGSVKIAFSDPSHALLTRPDGTQINLQRFSFTGTVPSSPTGGTPQIGWWWAGSSMSGTGYGIEIQGSSVFIVAYVYDDSGNPTWYLATGALTTPSSYFGTWDVYAGGPQLMSPDGTGGASKVSGQSVPMSLTFSDSTHGTLTMGNVTIPIVRFQEF